MRLRTIADIATNVRARRTDLGLTQAALATKAGVSRKWIVDLEAGKASIEIGLLLRVLDALDIALMATEAAPDAADTELDSLLDAYRRG